MLIVKILDNWLGNGRELIGPYEKKDKTFMIVNPLIFLESSNKDLQKMFLLKSLKRSGRAQRHKIYY